MDLRWVFFRSQNPRRVHSWLHCEAQLCTPPKYSPNSNSVLIISKVLTLLQSTTQIRRFRPSAEFCGAQPESTSTDIHKEAPDVNSVFGLVVHRRNETVTAHQQHGL